MINMKEANAEVIRVKRENDMKTNPTQFIKCGKRDLINLVEQRKFYRQTIASARKSYGSYKPILKFVDGRTVVIGQAKAKMERGETFTERIDAIKRAQSEISEYECYFYNKIAMLVGEIEVTRRDYL